MHGRAQRRLIAGAGERGQRLEFCATVASVRVGSTTTAGTLEDGVDALDFLIKGAEPRVDGSNGSSGALGECIDLCANCGEVHVDSLSVKWEQRIEMRRELGDRGSISLRIRVAAETTRR